MPYRRDDPNVSERVKTISRLIEEWYRFGPRSTYYEDFWCDRHSKQATDHTLIEFQNDLRAEQNRVNSLPPASKIRAILRKGGFQEGSDYELHEYRNKFGKDWTLSCPADGTDFETLAEFIKHAKRYGPPDWEFLREAEAVSRYYLRGR